MQRMSVDLPDPDGPQMTMRSRGATSRSMSRRTWKDPNHLLSSAIRMIGSLASVETVPAAGIVRPSYRCVVSRRFSRLIE